MRIINAFFIGAVLVHNMCSATWAAPINKLQSVMENILLHVAAYIKNSVIRDQVIKELKQLGVDPDKEDSQGRIYSDIDVPDDRQAR